MPGPQLFGPGERRLGSNLYGGQPLALPQVTTLPASAITNTSCSLNGSVNPQGSATQQWFVWGTTPQYGNLTASASVGSGAMPVAVNVNLTGLLQGTTYHFAAVGQSAAGTVYGFDQTFVAQTPQVVTDANFPLQPVGLPSVGVPHFAYPFTLTTMGGANVVEQDSLAEVFACVQAIVNCPNGACPELPGFGVPELLFTQAPLGVRPMLDAVRLWEPRAQESAVVQALDDTGGSWGLDLTTQTVGTTELA